MSSGAYFMKNLPLGIWNCIGIFVCYYLNVTCLVSADFHKRFELFDQEMRRNFVKQAPVLHPVCCIPSPVPGLVLLNGLGGKIQNINLCRFEIWEPRLYKKNATLYFFLCTWKFHVIICFKIVFDRTFFPWYLHCGLINHWWNRPWISGTAGLDVVLAILCTIFSVDMKWVVPGQKWHKVKKKLYPLIKFVKYFRQIFISYPLVGR